MAVVRAYGDRACLLATRGMKVPKSVGNIVSWFKEAKKALKSERCFDDVKLTSATMDFVSFEFCDGNVWTISRKENSLGMR